MYLYFISFLSKVYTQFKRDDWRLKGHMDFISSRELGNFHIVSRRVMIEMNIIFGWNWIIGIYWFNVLEYYMEKCEDTNCQNVLGI